MTQFEKLVWLMKKPLIIIFYGIFVILAYHFIDKSLATYFYQHNLRVNMHILSILTVLGQSIVYVVLFPIVAFYFRFIKVNPVYEARAWYLLSCVLVANVVCFVIKVALSRARPDLLFSSDLFGFYWFKLSSVYWSFPSGHTTTVVSLAAGLGVLFPRYFYAVLSLALLVIATRVLLYHHYLSDVMAAFYLSILVIGFYSQYLKKNHWLDKMDLAAN